MATKVGKLHRNKIVKDFGGNIIDWYDEARGGWIVQKRQVVNKELWNEFLKKEADKKEAAKAVSLQRTDNENPERNTVPTLDKKMEEFEKKINEQLDAKLDTLAEKLLKAIQK